MTWVGKNAGKVITQHWPGSCNGSSNGKSIGFWGKNKSCQISQNAKKKLRKFQNHTTVEKITHSGSSKSMKPAVAVKLFIIALKSHVNFFDLHGGRRFYNRVASWTKCSLWCGEMEWQRTHETLTHDSVLQAQNKGSPHGLKSSMHCAPCFWTLWTLWQILVWIQERLCQLQA